jgi:hypothetical protein
MHLADRFGGGGIGGSVGVFLGDGWRRQQDQEKCEATHGETSCRAPEPAGIARRWGASFDMDDPVRSISPG